MKKACKALFRPMYISMIILSILRICLGCAVGVWFPAGQLWDDALLMNFSDIAGHFLHPERYALVKDMSFPVFLKFSSVSHLPYTVVLSLLWIVAALVVFYAFSKVFKSERFAFCFFIYVLFMPQAFEFWSGTRLYRNAIIDPFAIITLSLMVNMIRLSKVKGQERAVNAVFTGIFFTFTYYIKEDGIWLLACLSFSAVCGLVHILTGRETRKASARSIAVLLIPIGIFAAGTEGYKAINYKFFGVYEINTRTGGEYGKFVKNIYKINSQDRSMAVWTPADAIYKAFAASDTLRNNYADLWEALESTEWQGGSIANNPIQGDHLCWILREEMFKLGIYESEAKVEELFAKVNAELDEAFKSSELTEQQGVIQLVSSAGGYTVGEIKSLKDIVAAGIKGAVLLDGYKTGLGDVDAWEIATFRPAVDYAVGVTKLSYLADYSEFRIKSDRAVNFVVPLLYVYKLINSVLFIMSVLILLYELICIIINVKTIKTFLQSRCKIYVGVFGTAVFLGISIMYAFAISWFSAFLFTEGISMTILNFYNIALPGLLMFSYIFAGFTVREEVNFLIERGFKS